MIGGIMSDRFYNKKTETLVKDYKPFISYVKRKHGKKEFAIFETANGFYKHCLKRNVNLLLSHNLNYIKNLTQVIKQLAKENTAFIYTGKKNNCQHYKVK